jgi:uncharacterized protein (DUF2141 family)
LYDRGDAIAATTQQGAISGRVVTGVGDVRPVRLARVFLNRVDGPGGATVITDDEGRFAFPDLPAGRYLLGADKPGFVRMNHGETRPGRPGSAVVVTAGQQTNLTLYMVPGGVITGTVFDQAGNGASEVEVYVFRTRMRSGELNTAETNSVMTDDRGVYRIYGLTPGEYVIAASPAFRFGTGAARETTPAEFARATSTVRSAGTPVDAQRRPRPFGYSAVYYPGTFESANATRIPVTAGLERSGIDISLPLIPLSSVAGRVTWPGTRPKGQRATVVIVPLTQSPWLHGMEFDAAVGNDLTFAFRHVAPGRYAILAQTVTDGEREGADAGAAAPMSAVHEIDVQGGDIDGLVLALQTGASLSGRLASGGANAATRLDPARISLQLRPAITRVTAMRPASTTVDADGTFAITGITPGAYRLVVRSRPADRAIASAALINGVNVLDDPVDFRPGVRFDDVVVTFADQPTELSGVMQDRAGRPAPEHHIVVFPVERHRWFRDSRHIQAIRPATDGRYTVRGLPPGNYFIAALTDVEDGEWFDPAFLDALIPAAIEISLSDGEKKVQDIRIGGL